MLVTADLTSIPLTILNLNHTCQTGRLLNFTNYCDFPQFINSTASTIVDQFFETWRLKFPSYFRNISNEELASYLELARNSSGFYNVYVLPALGECETQACLSLGTLDEILECTSRRGSAHPDCDLLQIDGNPDIAGIGLFVAYIVMVATYTILTFSHLFMIYITWKRAKESKTLSPILTRCKNILNSVSLTFLDSTTYFSISILIAGHFYLQETTSYYEIQFAQAISSLSITPLVTLTCFIYPVMRRKRFRLCIAALATGLFIAQFFRTTLKVNQGLESDCFHLKTVVGANIATLVTFALYGFFFAKLFGLGLLFVMFYLLVPCVSWKEQLGKYTKAESSHPPPASPRNYFFAFLLLPLGLSLTWANMASVITMRNYSQNHRNDDNEEDKWGYGQVVALFLWAQVAVDLIYVIFYGEKAGLEGRVPIPFVVQSPDVGDAEKPEVDSSHGGTSQQQTLTQP